MAQKLKPFFHFISSIAYAPKRPSMQSEHDHPAINSAKKENIWNDHEYRVMSKKATYHLS